MGSEMCIRDRDWGHGNEISKNPGFRWISKENPEFGAGEPWVPPISKFSNSTINETDRAENAALTLATL